MNSLETEYSFLAPTWKLPSVGTSSLYPVTTGVSYTPTKSKFVPEMSNWNNIPPNTRYVPPNSTRRNVSQQVPVHSNQAPPLHPSQHSTDQYQQADYSNDILNVNEPSDSQGGSYPPQFAQKRVQILDHNRQTPSIDYISERGSHDSHSPEYNPSKSQKAKPRREFVDENKSDSTRMSLQRTNNFNIHEYLYGLSAPDPGSYVSAYKNQRRRLEDEKVHRKGVMTEYKSFTKNGGFGPAFGNKEYQTYEERLEAEKKRKIYAQQVREINQYKSEEHKRLQSNNGQSRNRTQGLPMPRIRHSNMTQSHFLSAQEGYVDENYIEKPCYTRPRSPTDMFSPLLYRDSFDCLHPWYQNDILSGELYVDQWIHLPSMKTRQSQSTPPTVTREHFYQFLQTNSRLMATTNNNNKIQKKPILIVRTSESNSSKTTSRNVHFSPEIILDDEQITMTAMNPSPTNIQPTTSSNFNKT